MDIFNAGFYIYWAAVSIISLYLIVSDKSRAIDGRRRIRESVLFLFAALGGSAVMYLSMCLFRHKTQKNKFVFLIPLIFLAQFVLALNLGTWIFPEFT